MPSHTVEDHLLYALDASWKSNLERGPLFNGPYPERILAPESAWIDFLGQRLASPLGVAAGPLLDSKWTRCAARLGFDLVTYKTISHQARPGHPLPNILYLDTPAQMQAQDSAQAVTQRLIPPPHLESVAITNSFGNPCMDPDYLAADILRAREGLSPGQALCVSVFGFGEDPLASFQRAAGIAVDAGAALIEANLSCPNVSRGEGALYLDPEAIALVTRALKSVLGSTPLILKMGAFSTEEAQRSAFLAAARSGAQAISGINTIVGQIMRPAGGPALGPDRPTGGVCGAPIRDVGLSFTRRGRRLIEEEGLDLGLIAVGGVMCAEHAIDYLAAGADIVQSATGMMWDPYLAQKFHQARARKMELVHG